jgi:hypothetical protein
MSIPAEAEMLIGAPAEPPPDALVTALREAASTHPGIRSAFLFQMMILAEGEEAHLTLGLDLDEGADLDEIGNDLGPRAAEILPEGSHFDVCPLPEDMRETVAQSVEPFYVRP